MLLFLQLVAEPPKLAEYQAYIDFELKEGDPARVQIIFERTLAENCLVPDMWAKYTNYLVSLAEGWPQYRLKRKPSLMSSLHIPYYGPLFFFVCFFSVGSFLDEKNSIIGHMLQTPCGDVVCVQITLMASFFR